jgi:hypothetical protein
MLGSDGRQPLFGRTEISPGAPLVARLPRHGNIVPYARSSLGTLLSQNNVEESINSRLAVFQQSTGSPSGSFKMLYNESLDRVGIS